ncbi:MAG: RusA family crossover junction endodeoxyribonuclease [Sporichthyaceae bacterium]
MRWLRSKDDSGDWPSFFAKELFLRPLLHKTMAEKASTITQISCPLHNPDDAPGGLRVFPIGIPPWSAQSAPDRSTIRQAVSDALKSQQRDPLVGWHGNEPLCLTITALVPSTGRRKDTDNLVKGLLDALQGYLYGNDGQVDCLNVRRVPYAGTTGCYFVTAGPILPWDSDVVCDDGRAPHLLFGLVPWPTTKCP